MTRLLIKIRVLVFLVGPPYMSSVDDKDDANVCAQRANESATRER